MSHQPAIHAIMTRLTITATLLLLATSVASSQPAIIYAPGKGPAVEPPEQAQPFSAEVLAACRPTLDFNPDMNLDLTCRPGIPADERERLKELAKKCVVLGLMARVVVQAGHGHEIRDVKPPAWCKFHRLWE